MNLFAQTAVEHVLNTLPEGLLLAAGAWLLLRLLPRQNSGTRFAIWLVALAGVAGLPFLGVMRGGASSILPQTHPEITLSPFWGSAFLLLWVPISLLALARVAAGLWQIRRVRKSCNEVALADVDPMLRAPFADLKRPVRLLISDSARVPAAMGFRHPVVVLPVWTLRDLPADALRHILIHELAHIRRHDDWTNLVQKIARAVFFFHPAVWWIDARLSLEREMACDEAVLAATRNPRAYAGCLIDLLERGCARRGWTMAQAAVARAHDASVRIARILQESRPASTRLGRRALGLAAGVSLACSGVVLCSPGLVGFAPAHARGSDFALAARGLQDVRVPASDVVPAIYHPAGEHLAGEERSHAARPISRPVDRGQTAPPRRRHPATEFALVRKRHESQVPVVMASLKHAPPTQPLVSSAYLIIQSEQYVPATGPLPTGARTASIDEGSIVRVQLVQVVRQDANGIHVEVFRLVMRVPAAIATEGRAQSI
ncbi:MAG TPA: M56 family metallopeptidase [Acidobacteriaceae bacterium]|jgi:beta-lactamase regulating signal transducer with metallopeptidase domain|nr:M56 family metallopeptidase [Acidobacteriaceae bacterium]